MNRSHVAALSVVAVVIACNISDSTVGPRKKELQVASTVVPPTNNSACTVHWATGVNGSWFDATKWNPSGVPGSTSSVCIDAAGTYTVTLDAPVDSITPVLAISVGGTGATPTLTISGDHETVNVGEGVAIAAGASIVFNSGQGNTLTAAGTITNAGSLKVAAPCGGCGGATISADIINSGTIQILGGPKLTLSKVNGQYQNTGNMTFGGSIDIPAAAGNVVFSQEGGLYSGASNSETFTIRSGTFQLKGGKIRPRANLLPIVLLDGASLTIDSTATDSITLGVRGRTDAVPTITGNYPPLMTLWLVGASNGGNGTLELIGNPVNRGVVRASRFVEVFGGISIIGSGRLTNIGTLNNTDANRDTIFYSIDITNNGTINAIGQSSIVLQKPSGSYENAGTIDLQAGISRLVIKSNATFTNTSPATITNGAVVIDGSQFVATGTLATTLNVQNGGSVAPGFPFGLLTSLQLNIAPTGILNIDLGGIVPITQYDRAVATSLAGFSGTLNLSEVNGFRSGLCGQVFDVAYVPSLAAGMFPTINGLNPAPGRMLRPIFVPQTSTTPAILRLVGFDPGVKVCAGPDSVALSEGGPSLQYAVALRDAPTSTVVVKAVGDAQVTATDSAVFTTVNWQTPQILSVAAIDDNVYEGIHTGHVTHTVRSLDANYNAVAAGSITATITDNDSPPLVPTTVTVSIDSSSIQTGHTAQASAVVRDQNGNIMAGETVTWSSNTPSFASVSSSGVVTGVAAGTAVIKATDGSAFGTASITITAPPPPPPVVTTISVAIDSTSLQEGHTAQASATVRDQYGAVMNGQTITWSTDTPLRVSVSNAGVVTAISAGSASIRATAGAVSNTASLTVTAPPPPSPVVTTISVSIDSSSLQVGHTAQATAIVKDQFGAVMSGQTVTWSSNTPAFASVSAGGVVTAAAEGSAVIKATIGAVFGTASLSITAAPPPPPVVTTISVSIDSSSLQVGHTAQATAVVRDQYGILMNGQTISWSSDTPLLAGVSNAGVVTGIAQGGATIRATVGAVSNTASVAVTAPPPAPPAVTTIEVAIDSSSLQVGNTAQATATVKDQYGAVMTGQTIVWTSLSPTFASASSSGVVTGLQATLTASIRASVGGVNGSASIAIYESPRPTTIVVSVDSSSLQVGHTAQANALVKDQNGVVMNGQTVTWSTATPSLITISSTGLITALAAGSADVTATAGSAVGSASVQVGAAPPESPEATLVFVVASSPIAVGETGRAFAVAFDKDGFPIYNLPVEWRSLDRSVISVSPSGVITALKPGVGTVEAIIGRAKGTAEVTVLSQRPPVPRKISLVLTPLFLGDSALVSAYVYDQYGAVMPNQPVNWDSQAPGVLSLSPAECTTGSSCRWIKAVGLGIGHVEVTLNHLWDSKNVFVEFGARNRFEGTVNRSTKYSIQFFPGCAWNVYLENTWMNSDWRNGLSGRGSAGTRVQREIVGGQCPGPVWYADVGFTVPSLSEGTEVELQSQYPKWYRARFRLTKVTRDGMSGILTIVFIDFGGRSFEISQSITLK